MKRFSWMRTLLMFMAVLLVACSGATPVSTVGRPAAQYDSVALNGWYALLLELVQSTPGWSPPVVARAFGYIGVAAYEAAAPGQPGNHSLAGQLNGLRPLPAVDPTLEYYWPAAVTGAVAAVAERLFASNPAAVVRIGDLYRSQLAAYPLLADPAAVARSEAFGASIGLAIYGWSLEDGGGDGSSAGFPAGYVTPIGDGLWISTNPQNPLPLLPFWGNTRPFVLATGADCLPPAPPAFSVQPDSAFYREAREVYQTGLSLSGEQKTIAQFWADNPGTSATPPGHSISILMQILALRNASLIESTEAYAKMGIVLSDAFVSCWYAKYHYDLIRPETFINQVIDPAWRPSMATPPFPEYPSGHSVQSGAAAALLNDLFGSLAFSDYTHVSRGYAARPFASFDAFAQEAAISRLYGGIHYRAAIEQGLDQGRCVAAKLARLTFR